MSSYQAKALLVKAASYYLRQKEAVSKIEIRKKINEIKYLSAQKKVPKISLRKEIIHLENTLEGIFELENALLLQQKRESVKINALKAEIAALKRLLSVSGDKDLRKKVDHLAHVLGSFKAKEEIGKDVALSWKAAAKEPREEPSVPSITDEQTIERVRLLQERLEALKQELAVSKELRKDSGRAEEDSETKEIERKILLLETSLNKFYRENVSENRLERMKPVEMKPEKEAEAEPEAEEALQEIPFSRPIGVRHTFILGGPGEKKELILSEGEKRKLEKELPLPPPPRMAE